MILPKKLFLLSTLFLLSSSGFAQVRNERISFQIKPGAVENWVTLLYDYYPLLATDDVGLKLVHDAKTRFSRHLTFQQTYKGLPIYGCFLKLNLDNTGRTISSASNLLTIPSLVGSFKTGTEIQLQSSFLARGEVPLSMDAYWYATANELKPVWRVETSRPGASATEVVITDNNEVLLTNDLRMYYSRPSLLDTNGVGYVYAPDPLSSAEVSYGGSYQDIGDATNAALDAERISVTLQDLTFDPALSIFRLEGLYVKLEEIEGPVNIPATSANGQFYFNRSEPGFEQVNIYYHIDAMQRYIQGLGFAGLGDGQLSVDAHSTTQDQSYYVSGSSPYLGFGTGGIDDGEDADVIIHEYGHSLSDAASPNSNSGTQRRGLDEGICDYLAVSYSSSFSSFGLDKVFNWDGNLVWEGRPANSTDTYPLPSGSNIYDYGSIWCSAMTEILGELGRDTTDILQLEELYYNFPGMTLPDAAREIIRIDSLMFGGAHDQTIRSAMCSRGLLSEAECAGVDTTDPNPIASILLYPNPTSTEVSLNIPNETWDELSTVGLFNLAGVEIFRLPLQAGRNTLSLAGIANGQYIVQLKLKDGKEQGLRLLVIGQ